jgi:FtsZ-binding cell division protein ZapB
MRVLEKKEELKRERKRLKRERKRLNEERAEPKERLSLNWSERLSSFLLPIVQMEAAGHSFDWASC